MIAEPCQICSNAGTHQLGKYAFCDTHYAHAIHRRGSLWQADVATIVVLLLFVLLVTWVEQWLHPTLSRNGLLGVGILLSFVPAFIWLTFFYRRDRFEPEPKSLVLRQFLLGALLAGAVGIPLVNTVFDVPNWLSSSPIWAQLLGGLLIVGFTQEFLKYAAVRFFVYYDPEFDELTDGIIYATSAGLGYATALNVDWVVQSGGVELGGGVIRIVLTALAHASFAGIVGYFISNEKFTNRSFWWMPLGLFIAAMLNTLFTYFRGSLTRGSLSLDGGYVNGWIGLFLAIVLAVTVTIFLARTIEYDLRLMLQSEGDR